MQQSDQVDTVSTPSEDPKHLMFNFHEPARYARLSTAQHLLLIIENASCTRVELSYSSSRILELLISNADKIVSRGEIFAFAWPDRVVSQNSLNQAISSIRDLIGDEELRTIIQTVPRRGYRFNSAFLSPARELPAYCETTSESEVGKSNAKDHFDRVVDKPKAKGAVFKRIARYSNHGLMLLVVVLFITLLWRIDWGLMLRQGLHSAEDTLGSLSVLYISESDPDLAQLQVDMKPTLERIQPLIDQPETVIFNKMHGFYEILCIDKGKRVQFISIHKSKLSQLTDEQLRGCVK